MIMMIITTMDIEMCTGPQKRDSQCMTQLILITMATAIGDMMNGMDSDMGTDMNMDMAITETIISPILMKKMKSFTSSTAHMVNTMENISVQTQVSTTGTIMMMNSVTFSVITTTTMDTIGNMTTMSTHMISCITVLFQNTSKGSTTHISITMDMDTGSGTTMSHGIMRDTSTKNMTGKVLTNGKESSIMNMHTIHTQMIRGSRKQSQALVSHDHRLIKPLPTRHQQRNLHKDQSQRKRESLLQHLLQHQPQLQLQSKLHQNPNQRQRLHLKNLRLQNNKKRKLKNRKRNRRWPRSLPRRRKL